MKDSVISTTPDEKVHQSSDSKKLRFSGNFLLKACIFATGLAGIVAEYVMSTLASYILGNTVLQWTLTVSTMLFAMGVGSRLSKYIRRHLLDTFIMVELILSVLCAVSATLTYFLSSYIQWITPFIYAMSFGIGLLIGLEIPLATRLNDYFEDLRINISSVMEKDYYGALLGGLIFAFLALPHLGLTYTPIVLGAINFLVATALFLRHGKLLKFPAKLGIGFGTVFLFLITLAFFAKPLILYGEQRKYVDRVIYQEQSPYQRIVITEWKNYYWLYLNGNEQFSSYDEERYHEPLVHPAMHSSVSQEKILILGGGDGLAAREVLKYPRVNSLVLVDLDPAVIRLGRTNPIFLNLNRESLLDPRVNLIHQDAYAFLQETNDIYDVIIIDLPDPKTVDLARLYSREFYQLASRHLARGGTMVTQASSPFFSPKAFLSILKTMNAAGLTAIAYHNHIPTLGEWGWVLGINSDSVTPEALKNHLARTTYETVDTRFLNRDAMISMLHFGKGELETLEAIRINHQLDLVVFQYYKSGNWELY